MSGTTKVMMALGMVTGLGVATLPMSSHAAPQFGDKHTANVGVSVDEFMKISVRDAEVRLSDESYTGSTVVNVVSTSGTGYALGIMSAGVNNATALTNEAGDRIAAMSATVDAPAELNAPAEVSQWGYHVASMGDGKYAGVTEAAAVIARDARTTGDAGHDIAVDFKAVVNFSQSVGTYRGTVKFIVSSQPDTAEVDSGAGGTAQ